MSEHLEIGEVRDLEPPRWLTEKITAIGGLNPFGEPNFRVIWGWKRLAWHGGKFYDRDDSENIVRVSVDHRLEPKYLPANRWYFEAWLPPEAFGTPEEWEQHFTEWIDGQRVETLGPYPKRGDYECVMVLQTQSGGYVPLTETAAIAILNAVVASRNLPARMRHLAREERRKQKQRQQQERTLDKLESRGPAFQGREFVTVPKIIIPKGEPGCQES